MNLAVTPVGAGGLVQTLLPLQPQVAGAAIAQEASPAQASTGDPPPGQPAGGAALDEAAAPGPRTRSRSRRSDSIASPAACEPGFRKVTLNNIFKSLDSLNCTGSAGMTQKTVPLIMMT